MLFLALVPICSYQSINLYAINGPCSTRHWGALGLQIALKTSKYG